MSEMPGISNPDDFPVAEKYHDLLDDPEIITQLFRLERIRKKMIEQMVIHTRNAEEFQIRPVDLNEK